ncbi:hypothetical protein OCU04_009166 [Sclerotinia nivalis]|uniref:Uncharacterized protein n=1 Tax=Sclerotinia nivalis TaxID=352851 RepID=A0A9X0DH35_9HELO|nr:hypothetical protein OCU04_009166 [Sclerotinia nivalis]
MSPTRSGSNSSVPHEAIHTCEQVWDESGPTFIPTRDYTVPCPPGLQVSLRYIWSPECEACVGVEDGEGSQEDIVIHKRKWKNWNWNWDWNWNWNWNWNWTWTWDWTWNWKVGGKDSEDGGKDGRDDWPQLGAARKRYSPTLGSGQTKFLKWISGLKPLC